MTKMFEFYLELDPKEGGEPSCIGLKAPLDMSDDDLLRFISLAMVCRRSGDTAVPFNGPVYAQRLIKVAELLTEVETLIQEELREEFGLFTAINKAARLHLVEDKRPKPSLWDRLTRWVSWKK